MALHTLGLTGNLSALGAWAPPSGVGGTATAVTFADIAAIFAASIDDGDLAAQLQGYSFGAQAVLATGTTNGTTSVTSVAARGGTPVPVSQIKPGDVVVGINGQIVPGTFVVSTSGGGTTVTLSQAAAGSASGVSLIFARPNVQISQSGPTPDGRLWVPQRGWLKILPGDYVAVDNAGWPMLISGNAVGMTGSQWTFT